MLDAKLEVYEPTISANLYRHEPYLSVKLLYDSVRESIICLRMRDAID